MDDKQECWHPYWNEREERLDWLCDHLGDAQHDMQSMWNRLCELDSSLPKNGWPLED